MIKRFLTFAVILTAAVTLSASDPPAKSEAPILSSAASATPAKLELTVDTIMQGPRLYGYAPSGLRWSGDSKELYFEWRKPGEDEASTYAVASDGGGPRKLSDDEKKGIPPSGGQWDQARRRVLFNDGGDIVVFDVIARTRQQVTKTQAAEGNPRWARSDTHVTFTRDGNLFIMALATGSLQQLTNVTPRPREARETDSQKYVKAEEQRLIEYTKEQAAKQKEAEEKRKKDALPRFEIQEGQAASDLLLAPDEIHVFILATERPSGAKTADVPSYVTESSYPETRPARSLVGDAQSRRRLGVLNLKTGKTVWADAAFAGKRADTGPPADGAAAPAGGAAKEVSRDVNWSMPAFSPDGKRHVAVVSSVDFKDRWIVTLDPDSGQARVIDRQHDDAWIEGGGFGGSGSLGWLPDSTRIWFLSERDGWMHLYTLDISQTGAQPRQLTSGRFEVSAVTISADKKRFYFTSSERHPGERQFYTMSLDGGERTQITTTVGSHAAVVSPDDAMLGIVYSYATKPPEVCLMANRKGAEARQVTTSPVEAWRAFKWIDPQVITFKARDGADVYARLFTPEMIGARRDRSGPGVVFVHGAGYAQNAHKYWSTYSREYMFDNLLAARGYVVLDVDYRASAGYGRDWRTAIYRHMGGKDLEDIVDGAKYLVASQKVNPKRIGVYGGSYGGFITLMAMFTSPDTFAAGAALRPVTDWAHYNHSYTASILNRPQDDGEAYRRSSPIYFAEGLKGALLICHGMVDTNVFFQDSVRLAQRLIELRKENWELAVYPVENHGFEQETSWADEYRRILRLFETNLRLKDGKGVQ
jgi:dipeptidyl aminopeptidase/acylaminoacyl peptidase